MKKSSLLGAVYAGIFSLGIFSTFVSVSEAAVLSVDGSGQLTGATGVNVNGLLYDVSIGGGTCAGLFSGCDSASDFTFTTNADSIAASQALLDQVFIGTFDDITQLTQGCNDNQQCGAYVPYGFDNGAGGIEVMQARNWSIAFDGFGANDGVEAVHPSNNPGVNGTVDGAFATYAVFTPSAVPVPAAAWLFGSGLIGLIGIARRKKT